MKRDEFDTWALAGLDAVEAALIGQPPTMATFEAAADALVADAKGFGSNDFKIPLARRTLIATLRELTEA